MQMTQFVSFNSLLGDFLNVTVVAQKNRICVNSVSVAVVAVVLDKRIQFPV